MPLPEPHITRYQRWLRRAARPALRQLRRAVALVGQRSGGFWGSIWDYFASSRPRPTARCSNADDARRALVPGCAGQLRAQVLRHADAAHAAGHPAIVFCDERCSRAATPRQLARAAPPGGVLRGSRCRRMGVQRGDRVCAVLPNTPRPSSPFSRCQHRCRLVGVFARHGAGGGAGPLPPDRAGAAVRRRRLPLRRPAHDRRTCCATRCCAGLPVAAHRAVWPSSTRRSTCATFAGPGAPRTASTRCWPAGQGFEPAGCPSTTRCGSSIPAAPPACPSPSCTATAAWCSRR
jgi:hypothetical protein